MTHLRRERRPGVHRGGAEGLTASSTEVDDSAPGCQDGIAAQLRRRRAASWRCPPLACGRRDPWPELPRERWTDRELESWRAAWLHIVRAGYPPVVPASVTAAAPAAGHCHGCSCAEVAVS